MALTGRSGRRPPWMLVPLALAAVVMAYPWWGHSIFWDRQIMLIAFLTLIVSGLNLSFGYAGELALGQVAMYAAGAYVGGYFGIHASHDVVLWVIVGALAALVVGLASGIPGLRLGGWPLAMVSFFLVLLIPDILSIFKTQTGGFAGLIGVPLPRLFGTTLTFRGLYLFSIVVTLIWLAVMRNLVNSRQGASFLVLRQSPVLASSLGVPVYRMKLAAYALGAIPAGLAGALLVSLDRFIDPSVFSFGLVIAVLAASVLGGKASVYGAVFGAALLQIGPLRSNSFQQYAPLVYGGFLLVTGVLLAQGVAGLIRPLLYRVLPSTRISTVGPTADGADETAIGALPGDELVIDGLTKSFGGVRALEDVSLRAIPGRITAIIGPNGSGKTTLLNIISGFYRPDRGIVRLGDDELQRRSPHAIAQRGVARTFQTPLIPTSLTTAEVVSTGRYARTHLGMPASILRLPSFWRTRADDGAEAARAMALVGLSQASGAEAASLPLGTRRLVEVARALAGRPRVLLFDEVASGLDQGDLDHLVEVMRAIRQAGATILLVEHNFRLVLELADEIFVLANGQLLASGPPEEIAAHPGVLEEYLGVHAVPADELPGVARSSEEAPAAPTQATEGGR